jgi:peptidoglycan pentaglycine glycine transferase (the first glycine)
VKENMSDIRQSKEWAQYLTELGWSVIETSNNYLYIRKIAFLGNYLKIPCPNWPLELKKIDTIALQHKALFAKITPAIEIDSAKAPLIHQQLMKHEYFKEYWTPATTKIMQIDLAESERNIFKSFHKKTRQYINMAQRKGVKIIESQDIDKCVGLYLKTAQRNKFAAQSIKEIHTRYKVFKKTRKSIILLAVAADSTPVATLLILLNSSKKEAFLSLAGTSNEHRNLRASYLLHWQAIVRAKKMGYQIFNFDGIEDKKQLSNRNWGEFSFFKKGFRGKEITYLGSYIKFYNPILNTLFRLFIKIAH